MIKILKETLLGTAVLLASITIVVAIIVLLLIPGILAGQLENDAWMLLYLILIPILGFFIGRSEASGGDSEYM